MNKGSFTHFVKGNTAHRFPKVVALAASSFVLVAMIAIDASASPSVIPSITGSPSHSYVFVSESSLSQLFGFGRFHRVPVTSTTSTSSTTASVGAAAPSGGGGGGGGGGGTTTTTTPPTTTTTAPPTTTTTAPPTTTTTAAPSTPSASAGGLIQAGPSRSECLLATTNGSSLAALQSAVAGFDSLTGSTVTCIGTYNNSDPTWSNWDDPWILASGSAYTGWVAANPQVNQIVLEEDLIPESLADINNPLSWEQSCASGDYDSYAVQLAQNLVAGGLQNTVIRLGAEMNGTWENDFMGTTTQEEGLWATCFANEVTAMRSVSGEHFLFDWNPNSCYENVPFANYYPGNQYVDILGLDQYDQGCDAPTTALTFSQLASEGGGIDGFEAFASAQGKPISFPEWGLDSSPAGDDPGFVDGIGATVENGDVAFQEYFDAVDGGTLMLGSGTPLSVAQYAKWFASN